MDKKIEDKSDDEMENSEDPELAPLRALQRALNSRIRVSTSRIQIVRNDPNTTEFVGIEGDADVLTLQCLKESLSDLVTFPDVSERASFVSKTSKDQTDSVVPSESSAIHHESTSQISQSSLKTDISNFSIPSCTSSFEGSVDPEALRNAEEAIADLQSNGPAGLVQLSSLSDAIQKPIRVWISGTEESRKVGRKRTGETVDIEYHEPAPGEECGHWTLRGNQESRDVQGQLNDCLFSVVADQTGHLAPELRAATVSRMRKNIKSLANRIEKIAKLEKCDRISLMVGGARYTGIRPQDTGRVIDNSQYGHCHPNGAHGHPRGHASYPQGTGPTDSAENYSSGGLKSAFLSREDQDAVGHLALQTQTAKQAMNNLNSGQTNVAIHIRPQELEPGPLPKGVEFFQGSRRGGERPFRELVLVLRHHQGEENNRDADVFVHTFYPVLQ